MSPGKKHSSPYKNMTPNPGHPSSSSHKSPNHNYKSSTNLQNQMKYVHHENYSWDQYEEDLEEWSEDIDEWWNSVEDSYNEMYYYVLDWQGEEETSEVNEIQQTIETMQVKAVE